MSACPPIHKLLEPFIFRYLASDDDAAETTRRIKAMIEDQSRYLPTQIAFSSLMSKFVVCGLDLLNYNDPKDVVKYKMSGLIIFDCLLDVNDEITPERRIEVANHICKVLENDKLPLAQNEVILRKAATCIGHFGRIASINEIDFLQNFCFPLVMKLCAARSDSNRFAGAIVLTQLAQNSPTLIFSKRKTLFNVIWDYVADKTPLVRASAAETLESTLQLISQREPMTEYVTMALKQMDAGFLSNVAEKTVGGLLILDIIVRGTVVSAQDLQNIMRTQDLKTTELIWKVFQRKDSRDSEVRQKVVEIIPSLASTFPAVFSQANNYSQPYNYLGYAIRHLTDVINAKKERTTAYIALGKLFIAMASYLKSSSQISDIFNTICLGFKDPFCPQALQCLGMIINVSLPIRKLVEVSLVDQMFRGGLTVALTENLKIVIKYAPHIRHHAQIQLRKHILSILNRCTVLIDEIQSKTPNARSARSSTPSLASPQPTNAATKTSKWSAGPSSLFGALKSSNSETPVISLAPQVPPGSKPEEELIFALKVLSSPDFFPKQVRERTLSGSFADDSDDSLQLLSIVRDGVVRYLDDYSPEIRSAAAETCAAVLDIIVNMIDPSLNEFKLLYQILDRLLIMGVGDDIVDIRVRVFKSLQPSLDHIVAMTENVHCLIEALNDESLEVRAAAMTVMSRVAHFDTLHVMPVVRLTLNRLIQTLNNNKDNTIKQESVQLLQALVKGSDLLIVPYVKQLMRPLMSLLNDPSAAVVVAALSTIGDLAVASPESVREHLDELTMCLIAALNDQSSEAKQETAVIAMGKLVSSLTMVSDDPYQKYSGLFEGLVRAIQSVDGSSALRLQAIKTVGLLGVVETKVYTGRLNIKAESRVEEMENPEAGLEDDDDGPAQPQTTPNSNGKNVSLAADKKMTKMEKNYFSVVIRELMNILRDSSLTSYHQTAVNIAVKTIRIAGAQTPNLKELIDGITYRLYQLDSGNNLKEMLLDHFITVIQIIGRGMRVHLQTLVRLINDFFESNLQQCLDIVEALSTAFSVPDFNTVLRAVLPTFIRVIEEETAGDTSAFAAPESQVDLEPNSGGSKTTVSTKSAGAAAGNSDRSRRGSTASVIQAAVSQRTSKILQKIVNLSDVLGEYRRDLIPFIIKILDCSSMAVETRKDALCTVMQLANDNNLMQEFASRIIHPLLRLMSNTEPTMQSASLTALSCMVCRLGTGYVPFIIPVRRKTHFLPLREGGAKMTKLEEYEYLVNRLLKQRPLPSEPSDMSDIVIRFDERIRQRGATVNNNPEGPFSISIQALDTAWALSGRNNASDLVEWMRRLSIELIRQSPSPVIRSCWTLAKTFRPIAEELFNSSLNCIWEELFSGETNDVVDNNHLINGIETALSSPQIPSNIMIALLNVAEFMDMQDKRLPIDVRLLGKQAQSANMYAKSLRYREIEFTSKNVIPTIECIDAMITVNNQLGLADRARGVLVVLKANYPKIEIQPLWLEKLFRWDDARQRYEEQIAVWKARESELSLKSNEAWMNCELGRLRCLHALGEYEELEECAQRLKQQTIFNGENEDNLSSVVAQAEIQRLGANAAWMLGKWGSMDEFLEGSTDSKAECGDILLENNVTFYRTIMAIHEQDFSKATTLISETRRQLSGSISSLLSETYSRGYRAMVTMQVLAEMEEVIDYKQAVAKAATDLEANKNDINVAVVKPLDRNAGSGGGAGGIVDLAAKKINLIRKWRGRLKCAPKEIDVYRQILAVHTLVAEPMEDLDSWLELVTLCRKEGMFSLCENILRKLGAPLPARRRIDSDLPQTVSQTIDYLNCTVNDRVLFNTFKYWWNIGEKNKALAELTSFMSVCALPSALNSASKQYTSKDASMFRVRCLLKRADWMRELNGGDITELLAILMEARELASDHYSVWHAWAVANYEQLKKADTKDGKVQTPTHTVSFASPAATPSAQTFATPGSTRGKHAYLTPRKFSNSSGSASLLNLLNIQQTDAVTSYVVEAIKGFVRSIVLGQGQPVANVLQDILRLITLWFSYGTKKGVFSILDSELEKISPDNWLAVTPQLIARIHIKSPEISGLLRRLLIKVAVAHPQALVCPISVALNTSDTQQKMVATEVLREMRKFRSQLVEEATTVSRELMRVAITPHELWYDGLEQAAQLYMDNKDLPGMLTVLKELHDAMSDSSTAPAGDNGVEQGFSEGIGKIGNTTLRDVSFRHSYGKMLLEAQEWIDQFRRTGRTTDLHQAWEVYQIVFKKIKVQISTLKKLELHHISPALTNACDLSLAVPGTYKPFSPDICIKGFSPAIGVIASKQRPRRMTILGSDGLQYQFLLKGHEDLRQDERVMQLFGLINVCLSNDPATSNRNLSIVRYSVMPLSNNSGVIGWVQNCDTINQLVKQYRESKDIRLLLEVKLLQSKSLNYDKLPLMHKVELFRQVLEETTGMDLQKMLWLNSKTSDVWIERRSNFTRSLAVMSVVGYILGLGDRHPSNLMVDRISGRVVHIDFGDCFEITSTRSKYPEIIPFRLTRMLTNCMEASGTEGTYRLTCERVMRVLRDNRDSVMAMLEAFVYDPLISWRLLAQDNNESDKLASKSASIDDATLSVQKSPVDKMRDQLATSSPSPMVSTFTDNDDTSISSNRPSEIGTLREVPLRRAMSTEINNEDEPLQENLNARALEVINRIQAKLTGRDFNDAEDLTVEQQVNRLVKEATNVENLCQLFTGWCPLW